MATDSISAARRTLWQSLVEAVRGTHQDFTEGSISRAVLLLATPMVLEMFMESLFAIVDVFWVSRLGADAVATVGLTESILSLIYSVAFGVCFSTTAMVARRIGEKDPERKIPGFIVPSPFFDVGISPSGDLWVANPGRYELEKYSPEGSLLSHWGESSMALEGFAGCCNPSHFAFLSDGSFVTSEKGIVRVKICYPDGRFRYLVAGPESFEERTKGLDLAVDCRGRILVLDPYKHLVHIFIPAEKH